MEFSAGVSGSLNFCFTSLFCCFRDPQIAGQVQRPVATPVRPVLKIGKTDDQKLAVPEPTSPVTKASATEKTGPAPLTSKGACRQVSRLKPLIYLLTIIRLGQ